ncbi:MAG: acyl carrier protein [Hydrogenophaga sp.]|nr:acyl carrier protein [Hydrogenophaga sp.]
MAISAASCWRPSSNTCNRPKRCEETIVKNPNDIRQLVTDVLAGIAPEADLSTVGDHEDLREALDLDSMDFLNFIIGLSQGSGVPIPESDYPRLFTLQGLVAYLTR